MKRFLIILTLILFCIAASGLADRRGPFDKPARSVRSRTFDVSHTRNTLAFDFAKSAAAGSVTHTLKLFDAADTLEFDANRMTIQSASIQIDQAKPLNVKFDKHPGKLVLHLDKQYPVGQALTVTIAYRLDQPRHGLYFIIPDKHEPQQPQMVYSQSEPNLASHWFPCFDSPNDRMSSEFIATVPGDMFALSNGRLLTNTQNPDGTRTFHWKQEKDHPAYLISIVAGHFEPFEQNWDGIPVISYVPKGRLEQARRSFEKTPAMMAYFSKALDYRYPWEKYAQICVDEYMWGGMEHTSATTLNLDTLHDEKAHLDVSSDGLVAHELAHQWFGDLITCKDWGELWLNESFATYFESLWREQDLGWDEAAWERHGHAKEYLSEDSGQYRRPLATYQYPSPDAMFDSHTYPKGARVLHHLRFVLGEEQFWRAIRHYVKKHAHTVVESADLRVAIEEATGQSLNWFFDQWVHRGGHPDFVVSHFYDSKTRRLSVKVRQTQQPDALTPIFRTPVDIDITVGDKTITRRVEITQAEHTFDFEVQARPRRVCFDPRDFILKTLKHEKPIEEWVDQLAADPNVTCRLQAVWALESYRPDPMARDALIKALKGDTFWAVRQEAATILGKFNGEEVRKALLAAATGDIKSFVRRAALAPLDRFAHTETTAALRSVIKSDPSYYAVAESLRTLVRLDRAGAAADLTAALERSSHKEEILRAVCDGLVELRDVASVEKLLKLAAPPSTHHRRQAIFNALARLGRGNKEVGQFMIGQLDDARLSVRRSAAGALAQLRDLDAIEPLLKRRDKETRQSMLETIDSSVKQLRSSSELSTLQQEVETLRRQSRTLEEKVRRIEDNARKR